MLLNGHTIIVILSTILGGGVGVSLFWQLLKKIFGLESDVVIHTLGIALTALFAAAQYLIALKTLPPEILGISGPAIYGWSQLVFKYSKYAINFIGEVQAARAAGTADKPVSLTNVAKVAVSTAEADF